MARLMLSAGMFSALAAATAPRRRGLPSGSPPPSLAAMVISLIRRVKILPRLASRAPFLCLIVAHFEWPDMYNLSLCGYYNLAILAREQRVRVPYTYLRKVFQQNGLSLDLRRTQTAKRLFFTYISIIANGGN